MFIKSHFKTIIFIMSSNHSMHTLTRLIEDYQHVLGLCHEKEAFVVTLFLNKKSNVNLEALHSAHFMYSNYIFYIKTKCTHRVENIYILFIKYLLHVSAHSAPSSGRILVTCSKFPAHNNFITSVTLRKIYFLNI